MSTNLNLAEAQDLTSRILVEYVSQVIYDCDPNELAQTLSEDYWEEDDFDLVHDLIDNATVELVVSWPATTTTK